MTNKTLIKNLDCTLRDGGYYNDWDFPHELIADYLDAMSTLAVDYVEIGFRSLNYQGFRGGCAFSTDDFINSLSIPSGLKNKIGVMVNGSELIKGPDSIDSTLKKLFLPKDSSPVSLVRIACHIHEFEDLLPASFWLKNNGYIVGFNLMQIAGRSEKEIIELALLASNYPIDVLYFADSMGSLDPEKTAEIIRAFKKGWSGEIGFHAHDNMGQALANTNQAIKDGVTWVDSTVTGMGRGAGNAKTEYLAIELAVNESSQSSITKLLEVIRKHFHKLQAHYCWGSNPYYYLAGKYSIHPSYIQEMIDDSRYSEEDMLAVIDHLRVEGGKKYSLSTLEAARHFYLGEPLGTWRPKDCMSDKEVLLLGTGPGVGKHQNAIEAYIRRYSPYVISLNTQKNIDESLIDVRAACHPVRLLADCKAHVKLQQPLVTPASMLPLDVRQELKGKELLDYGLIIQPGKFSFDDSNCTVPTSLVVAYALAIATSGHAMRILLAGFDGYGPGDPRNHEMDELFSLYEGSDQSIEFYSITPTCYHIPINGVYGLLQGGF